MGQTKPLEAKDEDMEKRALGRTGIEVSVVGIGGEGFEGKSLSACEEIIDRAFAGGINFIDVYNSNPIMRSNVGRALSHYPRESFVVEGHIGSAWKDGQYFRTRDMDVCRASFQDLLERMQLDYVDVGMIHYVDERKTSMQFSTEICSSTLKSSKRRGPSVASAFQRTTPTSRLRPPERALSM